MLHPGYVRSRHDGDLHYVGVPQLLHLYKVPRRAWWRTWAPGLWCGRYVRHVHLYPRADGRYFLPPATCKKPGPMV